jgi:hypothetical protein
MKMLFYSSFSLWLVLMVLICSNNLCEASGSIYSATPVDIGSVTVGAIDVRGDQDYFSFTVTASGKYVIYTRGQTAIQATLYGSDYSSQTSLSASSGSGESNNFRMEVSLSPGTYYLEVMGYSIYGTGSYK